MSNASRSLIVLLLIGLLLCICLSLYGCRCPGQVIGPFIIIRCVCGVDVCCEEFVISEFPYFPAEWICFACLKCNCRPEPGPWPWPSITVDLEHLLESIEMFEQGTFEQIDPDELRKWIEMYDEGIFDIENTAAIPFLEITTRDDVVIADIVLSSRVIIDGQEIVLYAPMLLLETQSVFEYSQKLNKSIVMPTAETIGITLSFIDAVMEASEEAAPIQGYAVRHKLVTKDGKDVPPGEYFISYSTGWIPFMEDKTELASGWFDPKPEPSVVSLAKKLIISSWAKIKHMLRN